MEEISNEAIEFAEAAYEKNDADMAEIAEKLTYPDTVDKKGWTPMIHAGYWGMSMTIKVLAEKGGNPDIKTPEGCSALIYAVESGSLYAVKALIEAGANPNIANSEGWTPLIWASALGFYDIVSELLDAGANINIRNIRSMTALDMARFHHHENIENLIENFILQRENLLPIGAADCPGHICEPVL